MARLSNKQFNNAYANYKKRYKAKQKSMARRGLVMADTMLTKREYKMVRNYYVEEGRTININQTIVADQQYEYSQKTARQFKEVARKYNLDWKDTTITQLRVGKIDVSGINEMLKEEYPDWTGSDRANWISHEVFGSD